MRKIILMVLLAVLSGSATAFDYRCTVDRVVMTTSSSSNVLAFEEKLIVGKQFTVDRRTGIMAGILKNSYITKPVVIDEGSSQNSYKVVTTMRREEGVGIGSNIYALTINEFEKSEMRSFVFLENDTVYLGRCEHF